MRCGGTASTCCAAAHVWGLVGRAVGTLHMCPVQCHAEGMRVTVRVEPCSCQTSPAGMSQSWPHTAAATFLLVRPSSCPAPTWVTCAHPRTRTPSLSLACPQHLVSTQVQGPTTLMALRRSACWGWQSSPRQLPPHQAAAPDPVPPRGQLTMRLRPPLGCLTRGHPVPLRCRPTAVTLV